MLKTVTAAALAGVLASAGASQPTVGAAKRTGPAVGALTATTFGFTKCVLPSGGKTDQPPFGSVISVRLPRRLNFQKLGRQVTYKLSSNPDDPIMTGDPPDQPNPNHPVPPGAPDPTKQPFHIFLGLKQLGSTGFALVRVIIPAEADYTFYDEGEIHGVGVGDMGSGTEICGRVAIKNQAASGKQIAMFYVDLAKLGVNQYRSFNIGLRPGVEDGSDTVIFIDPKVHNDG